MSDIIEISNQILKMFKEGELSKAQSLFVLKAVEMSIHEEMVKEAIDEHGKADPTYPGVI